MNNKMTLELIRPSDRLPEEGVPVLVWVPNQPWGCISDSVFWSTAFLVKGISKEEREILSKSGNILDELRSRTQSEGDECGNNERPYKWKSWGPGGFFGQDVEYWAYLPTDQVKSLLKEDQHEQ